MSAGFVKMSRGEAGDELMKMNPLAFALATIIAKRARWKSGFNACNLSRGEALIGDFKSYGMSERQYRTAKCQLAKWGFATFKPTDKGTIAKLTDTRLFDVLNDGNDGQIDEHSDGQAGGAADGQPTTNEERKTRSRSEEGKGAAFHRPSEQEVLRYAEEISLPQDQALKWLYKMRSEDWPRVKYWQPALLSWRVGWADYEGESLIPPSRARQGATIAEQHPELLLSNTQSNQPSETKPANEGKLAAGWQAVREAIE